MEILYKRLDEMPTQGKLPIIKIVSSILAKYDQDNNGVLDRRSSRVRPHVFQSHWPLWKTAARGAGRASSRGW